MRIVLIFIGILAACEAETHLRDAKAHESPDQHGLAESDLAHHNVARKASGFSGSSPEEQQGSTVLRRASGRSHQLNMRIRKQISHRHFSRSHLRRSESQNSHSRRTKLRNKSRLRQIRPLLVGTRRQNIASHTNPPQSHLTSSHTRRIRPNLAVSAFNRFGNNRRWRAQMHRTPNSFQQPFTGPPRRSFSRRGWSTTAPSRSTTSIPHQPVSLTTPPIRRPSFQRKIKQLTHLPTRILSRTHVNRFNPANTRDRPQDVERRQRLQAKERKIEKAVLRALEEANISHTSRTNRPPFRTSPKPTGSLRTKLLNSRRFEQASQSRAATHSTKMPAIVSSVASVRITTTVRPSTERQTTIKQQTSTNFKLQPQTSSRRQHDGHHRTTGFILSTTNAPTRSRVQSSPTPPPPRPLRITRPATAHPRLPVSAHPRLPVSDHPRRPASAHPRRTTSPPETTTSTLPTTTAIRRLETAPPVRNNTRQQSLKPPTTTASSTLRGPSPPAPPSLVREPPSPAAPPGAAPPNDAVITQLNNADNFREVARELSLLHKDIAKKRRRRMAEFSRLAAFSSVLAIVPNF